MVRIISARDILGYEELVDHHVDGWYADPTLPANQESKGKKKRIKKEKKEETVFVPPAHKKITLGRSLLRRKS